MGHEDTHGHQVGLAVVVDEAADVAVETGIDAVHLPILEGNNRTALVSPGLLLAGQGVAIREHPAWEATPLWV